VSEPRLPRPREGLTAFRSYRTQQQPAEVRLQSNEWPEPNPVGRFLRSDDLDEILLNRYPDTAAARLRTLLAEEWSVAPDQLLFGNGSNEILLTTFLVFGGHGRTVLFFTPTYLMYARLGQILGMNVVAERVGLPYELDAARARRAVETHRPQLICFCRPNNPTGNVMGEEVVLAAAQAAPEALVLVDEAYAEFAGVTMLPHLASRPNIVIAKTFSKVRGAAGLRMGALIAHPQVLEIFDAVRLPYNVSTLTQAVAARIAADRGIVAERVALIARERGKVEAGLRRHRELEVFPSRTNFVLFRQPGRQAADLHAAILARGVLVRDVSMWPGADDCLRATIGTRAENDRLLAAVAEAISTPVQA
jgi:histidinol-phosphate aminotransferase